MGVERRRTGGGGLVVVAIRILVSGSSCFLVIISVSVLVPASVWASV